MKRFVEMLLDPKGGFRRVAADPGWIVPMLLLVVAGSLPSLVYFLRLDEAIWVASQASAEGADDVVLSTRTMAVLSAIASSFWIACSSMLGACYAWIASRWLGKPIGWMRAVGLVVWSSLPFVLGGAVGVLNVLLSGPAETVDNFSLTSFDPLLVSLREDSPWKRMAEGFDLLALWQVALFATGWREWTSSSWVQALMVAAVPTLAMTLLAAILG